MSPDMVKTIFTYLFALVALVGSMLLLRFPPVGIPPEALLTFVVSITSASLGYVFGERSAASATSNMPTTTITTGPPPSATMQAANDEGEQQPGGIG